MLTKLIARYNRWTYSRKHVFALLVLFFTANILLIVVTQPWSALKKSTWPCGFEMGRIARNLCLGKGYGSPFVLFPGDAPLGLSSALILKKDRFQQKSNAKEEVSDDQTMTGGNVPAGAAESHFNEGRSVLETKFSSLDDPVPPTAWSPLPVVLIWYSCFTLFGIYSPWAWGAFLVVQTILMTTSIYLFWRTLFLALSPVAASLGLFFLLTYPIIWHHCGFDTHGAAVFIFFFSVTLYSLSRFFSDGRFRWASLAALSSATAALTIPASLLVFVVFWFIIVWKLRKFRECAGDSDHSSESQTEDDGNQKIYHPGSLSSTGNRRVMGVHAGFHPLVFILILMVAYILVWSPCIIRNSATFGLIIPFGTNLPMEFWFGNNPDSHSDPYAALIRHNPAFSEAERQKLLEMGELQYGELCWNRFVEFAGNHPREYGRRVLERILFFWTLHQYKTNPWRPFLTILFLFYLGLFVVSLIVGRRRTGYPALHWLEKMGVVFLIFYPLVYYLTHFFDYRYRFPLEVVLLLLTAATLARLLPVKCRL